MFVVSKLLWWFAQPSRFWLLLVCLAVLLLFTPFFRRGRNILALAGVLALMVMLLPLHLYLLRPLEQRFPRPSLPEHLDGIIVLGGAVEQNLSEAYDQANLNHAAERMTEAVRIAKFYPEAKLVFSGGSAEILKQSKYQEADVAKRFFVELGLPESQIVLETRSRNTFENVAFSKELLEPKADEVWLLITSAMHMPRSVGIFRYFAWQVIPYPVDYRVGLSLSSDPRRFFSDKLLLIDLASKEWLGLLAYRFLGRTVAIFPAP